MSTYKEIVGKKIKKVSSDPSNASTGEMWYNSDTGTLRGLALGEAWISASPLSTGRYLSGSFGTQTAGVQVAGSNPSNPLVSNVEHYDGTGWSEETNYPASGQSIAGAGTQTAGIACGGSTPSMTSNAFSYNGTAWTAANSLPYAANNMASCGLAKTDVIYAVGRDGSSGNSGTNKSITFDGTNFANGPTHVTTRMFNTSSGAGTGTAGLIIGGFIDPSPNAMTDCEEYNGTSWSATGSLSVATGFATAWGTQTNAVTQVNTPNYEGSEAYNGTTWSALPNIGITSPGGLYGSAAGSTGDAGWLSSMTPTYNAAAEFNRSTNAFTNGAWSSGTSLPSNRWNTTGSGTQTAGLCWGGATGPGTPTFLNSTFEYSGSAWTAGGTTPISSINQFGTGIQTAAIGGGGLASTGSNTTTAYTYDGNSWTAITATPIATKGAGAAGTSTACLIYGSDVPSSSMNQDSYLWNGSSWSEEGAMNTSFQNGASGGPTENTAFKAGTQFGSPEAQTNFESYNGTAWSAGPALITAVQQNRGMGSSAECLSIGGYNQITTVERFNGTAWQTSPSLGTGRKQFASSNNNASGVSNGWVGAGADGGATVEHFTEATTTANVETFSTS